MRIRVIDLETTGVEPTDKVVEIAGCDLQDGVVGMPVARLINPGRDFPKRQKSFGQSAGFRKQSRPMDGGKGSQWRKSVRGPAVRR